MEQNNIILAPQIDGTHIFLEKWQKTHAGSLMTFYRFMTTPSPGRDEFIDSLGDEVGITLHGAVTGLTLRQHS